MSESTLLSIVITALAATNLLDPDVIPSSPSSSPSSSVPSSPLVTAFPRWFYPPFIPYSKLVTITMLTNCSTMDRPGSKPSVADAHGNCIINSYGPSENESHVTRSGHLCITSKDVDRIVRRAIEDTGNFIPREVKELSSNYPKPQHVGVISGILEEATKVLVNTFGLTAENIHTDLRAMDTEETIIHEICPTFLTPVRCEVTKYRTLSGMCNNLKNPSWAAARSAMLRFLPPVYEDGISEPRSHSASGNLLSNPRWISQAVHLEGGRTDRGITTFLATWGQIVVHDINFGSPTFDENGEPIRCCNKPASDWHPSCHVFEVPNNDPFYEMFNHTCLNFVRLTPGLRPNCPLGPREPMNIVSGYLDASLVYGSASEEAQELREMTGGRLKSHNVYKKFGLKDLLPPQVSRPDFLCHRQSRAKNVYCFKAGDVRANQQLPLTLIHTMLMREHNRLADEISNLVPHLDDRTIYEEARRILGAEMQVITYREFLPVILGEELMKEHGLTLKQDGYYNGYDPEVNAEPRVGFQAAAFRFGHSLITDVIRRYNKLDHVVASHRMSHLVRQPFELYKPGIVDTFLLGLMTQEAHRMDSSITNELRNHLFEQPGQGFGADLAAINIMRGREVGLPPYNAYREYCGLTSALSFLHLHDSMPNVTIHKLASVYESVADIDLWTGGVSESPIPGAIVGPTFACLIAKQFSNIKKGDRFWFENQGWPSSFKPFQLKEVRKASLARLICDNSDDISSVQIFPMLPPDDETNPLTECDSIPSMHLKNFFDRDQFLT